MLLTENKVRSLLDEFKPPCQHHGHEVIFNLAETCLAAMDRANKAEEALAKCECWNPLPAGCRDCVRLPNGPYAHYVDGRCGECAPCLARVKQAAERKEQGDVKSDGA